MRKHVALLAVFTLLACAALAAASSPGAGIAPDEAMQMLKKGNTRFVENKMTHPHLSAARLKETAGGQKPFATIIGCSDSRATVESIFDQGVGDLFVIRVAGSPAHVDVVGTAEYGVEHLGTQLVVVLGHTKCGAVTAAVAGGKVGGNIDALIAPIAPAAAAAKKDFPNLSGGELVEKAIVANVWQSIDDLYKQSPIVRAFTQEGKVKVVGAIYDIATGEVKWLGEHPDKAKLLAYTGGPH